MTPTIPIVALLVVSFILFGLLAITLLVLPSDNKMKSLGAEGDYYQDATAERRIHYQGETEEESVNNLKEIVEETVEDNVETYTEMESFNSLESLKENNE